MSAVLRKEDIESSNLVSSLYMQQLSKDNSQSQSLIPRLNSDLVMVRKYGDIFDWDDKETHQEMRKRDLMI